MSQIHFRPFLRALTFQFNPGSDSPSPVVVEAASSIIFAAPHTDSRGRSCVCLSVACF